MGLKFWRVCSSILVWKGLKFGEDWAFWWCRKGFEITVFEGWSFNRCKRVWSSGHKSSWKQFEVHFFGFNATLIIQACDNKKVVDIWMMNFGWRISTRPSWHNDVFWYISIYRIDTSTTFRSITCFSYVLMILLNKSAILCWWFH